MGLCGVHAQLVEMLVKGGALQFGQVEGHGRGRVLVLAEQLMAGEVVLGKSDQFGRGCGACAGEDLGVDMAGELLDANLVEAGARGSYIQSTRFHVSYAIMLHTAQTRFILLRMATSLVLVWREGRKASS